MKGGGSVAEATTMGNNCGGACAQKVVDGVGKMIDLMYRGIEK